jgi:hypothetical protein
MNEKIYINIFYQIRQYNFSVCGGVLGWERGGGKQYFNLFV